MSPLILRRAPIGWNQDDYDVLEEGVIVGRIFKVPIAPQDQPWMWASGHNGEIRRAAHGYERRARRRWVRSLRAGAAAKVTLACAVVLVAVAQEHRVGLSHTPNVYKPHAVPHQSNCPLSPLRRQAHPRCNQAFRPKGEPLVCR